MMEHRPTSSGRYSARAATLNPGLPGPQSEQVVDAERVAHRDKLTRSGVSQSEAEMKIYLVPGCNPVGSAQVDQLARTRGAAIVGSIAKITFRTNAMFYD